MHKILIIDDDLLTKKIIDNIITFQGLPLETRAGDLSYLKRKGRDYSLVFLSLDIGGLNIFQWIEDHPHKNYILITQYDYFKYAQWALRLGVVDILLKPLDPLEFIQAVERVFHIF
ncbi:MAG: response regulator, partial [Tissierellia bacterium]|nr:response regulator [Tissierellia bacterium]